MRISKTRLLLRLALTVAVALAVLVGYRIWQIRQPGYHWQRAEAALAASDDARAELELRACLARANDHAQAHLELARLLARKAQREGAGGAGVPAALTHLARAADLMPADLEVQQTLLRAYDDAGRESDAEAIAMRVARLAPDDPRALLLLARKALRNRDVATASQNLARLRTQSHSAPFYAYLLEVQCARLGENPTAAQAALSAPLARAARFSPADVDPLPASERWALSTIMLFAVETAPDTATAHAALRSLERAIEAPSLARLVPQLGLLLRRRFPADTLTDKERAERTQISGHLVALAKRQMDAGNAWPQVFQYLAEERIDAGDNDAAIAILNEGIHTQTAEESSREVRMMRLLCASQYLHAGRLKEAQALAEPLLAEPSAAGQARMIAGSVALGQGRFDDAAHHFREASQLLGETLKVRLGLATSLLAAGRPVDALPYLQAIVDRLDKLAPAEKAWLARYFGDTVALRRALFEALLAADREPEAMRQWNALRGSSEEPRARLALAGWNWRHGKTARAESLLASARQAYPNHLGLVLAQALLSVVKERPEDGDTLVATFAVARPDELATQLTLVEWYSWRGRNDLALKTLTGLRERFEGASALKVVEARLLLAAGRPDEALAASEKLRGNADNVHAGNAHSATLLAAEAALRMGRVSDAAAMLAQSPRKTDPLWDLQRARILSAQGQHAAALDLISGPLHVTAVSAYAGVQLGTMLDRLAQSEGTRAALEKATELLAHAPGDAMLLAAHANLAIAAGEIDLALADLERLDKIRPETALVPYLRAQAQLATGNLSAAAASARLAAQREPRHVDTRLLAGEIARRQGDFPEMLEQARRALELDPGRGSAWQLLSTAQAKVGQPEEAAATLKRFIAENPRDARGYIWLAAIHESQGNLPRALAAIRRGARILPRDFELLSAEVELIARSHDSDAADALVRHRAAEHPDAFDAERLGALMFRLQQYAAARHWADRFLATAGPRAAEAHWLAGNIALVEGRQSGDRLRLSEAEKHYRQVLAMHPDHFGAINNLAYLLAAELGEPDAALELLRKLLSRREFQQLTPEELPPDLVDTAAIVLLKAGRPTEALHMLAPAIRRHPDRAGLRFQFGLAQMDSRQFSEAQESLRAALQLGLSGADAEKAREVLRRLEHHGQAG